jgi:hypothetical protein
VKVKVKLLNDEERFNIKAGDEFEAIRYHLDPQEKMSLLKRLSDGFDPECNQYRDNLAFWIQGEWKVIINNTYVSETAN